MRQVWIPPNPLLSIIRICPFVARIVDRRRVTVHRSDLVELLGLITCGVRGIGQVAKLLGARAEVLLTVLSGRVQFDEDCADKNVVSK